MTVSQGEVWWTDLGVEALGRVLYSRILAKIERGLEQSESGETVSREDVKKRFLG